MVWTLMVSRVGTSSSPRGIRLFTVTFSLALAPHHLAEDPPGASPHVSPFPGPLSAELSKLMA